MKTFNYFALGSILLFAFDCELLDDTILSVAERLQGTWSVIENLPGFKSTKDAYQVEIEINEIDSNRILYVSRQLSGQQPGLLNLPAYL